MNAKSHECLEASEKLVGAIDVGSRFPSNVYRGVWSDFYLFDPDWMFEGAFVDKVSSLLAFEGATCACLANLDSDVGDTSSAFFIDSGITADVYQCRLQGTSPGNGWIYAMGRFACISNKGTWCIYCERQNELAVIGFGQDALCEDFKSVLETVCAGRVADVLAGRADYELSDHVASRDWRREILRQYQK
jgi:hypothetical protein